DRKPLPAPEAESSTSGGYQPPVGETESTLARVWAEVLQLDRVGRQDNFFELGGHSLLAVRLIERMRREGLSADVRALFTSPTLAELAAAVVSGSTTVQAPPNLIPPGCQSISPQMLTLVRLTQQAIERTGSQAPGRPPNVQDIYPLAPLQEGILFQHLLETEADAYLLSALLGFDSRQRLESYLGALQAVIDRHDILRTAVVWEELSEPLQVVWRQAPLSVEQVQLDPAAGEATGQLLARFNPRHYRLDVRRAPLVRAFIAEDSLQGRWLLLLLVHHLALDHSTLEIVGKEVQAHLSGAQDRLPEPLPFRNFVAQARLGLSRQEHEAF